MARRLTQKQKLRIEEKRQSNIDAMQSIDASQLNVGRVITQHGQHLTLENSSHELISANVRQSLDKIVCGDDVQYIFESDQAVVLNILPRKNELARIGFGGRKKLIASNLDQIAIVLAPKPEPSPSLIDRYLIAIQEFEIPVLFVINKCETIQSQSEIEFIEEYHHIFGYPYLFISTYEKINEPILLEHFKGKISILVGQSGVGKSSITNLLIPELALQTQKISQSTGLGNHTTSASTLYHLENYEGALIDSPGVRSFNIDHLTLENVNKGFPDLTPYIQQCKFSNCRHLQDPNCALSNALQEKKVSERRVQSYLQICSTL